MSPVDQLFHDAASTRIDAAEHAWSHLSSAGQRVRRAGVNLEGAGESLAELRRLTQDFALTRQPTFRNLGVA